MGWTEERIELLKKRWAEGLSASQIAAELGGVTRNAVIGKVHRLGLSGRAKTVSSTAARSRPKAAAGQPARRPVASGGASPQPSFVSRGNLAVAVSSPAPAARPTPAPRIVPIEVVETSIVCERVTIMELRENMCRWPIGDPSQPEFRFCGGRSTPGAAYCAGHSQVAYQPANDRRRDRRISVPFN
ncbi:GcrA family cell cycle regulator [Methylopila sp. M107]|uniref:GcrA family cell cycle regulator n=1 Tax=Methylopila sp. M107 TaxID=1101190 RepID=UPI00036CBF76|nr:GcrA family cell cycle regulator [Methylopila sp. M107]